MNKKEKIKIVIAATISLLLFCIFLLTSNTTPKDSPPPPQQTIKEITPINTLSMPNSTKTVILEINGKQYEDKIDGVTSIYDFMAILQKEGKINFKEKTYIGMGKLIEEINGIKNSGEKNWIYYVNEKKASIGVSNYKINPGDIVSWKYEKDIN